MRLVGALLFAVCALAALGSAGCGADGYTPACKQKDFSDCLEPPAGGQWLPDAGEDGGGTQD